MKQVKKYSRKGDYSMEFAKRMDRFAVSVFSTLAELKRKRIAEGLPVVDLSIGSPNIPPADHIIEAIVREASDKKNYVYAINDLQELHTTVADWYLRRYGVALDPVTQVTSLLGSQDGLLHITLSIADEGDVVLVPDPCYPAFADGPKLAGADIHYMKMRPEKNYLIDFGEIPEEVADRAKLMIVSYPNNPTTALAPDSWYEELIAFAKKHNIIVLHDNAYSELVFDGVQCGSFLRFPGAMDVGVEFNSLSKTYGLAGARIGFCVGNPQVVGMLARLKSNIDYGMFLPVQKGAIAALTGDQTCVKENCLAYQRRRDCLCDGLTAIGWPVQRSVSTMFVWAKIPANYSSSIDFTMDLLNKAGVVVTPGSAMGPSGEGYVRMALVENEDKIRQGIRAIQESGILG